MADDPVRLRWDGVEYALPLQLSPRERMRIHEWTGMRGNDFAEALEAGDPTILAGLVIVAMHRRGHMVDPDSILDDVEFDVKLGAPEDPTGAAGDAADEPPSTSTPAPTGPPS